MQVIVLSGEESQQLDYIEKFKTEKKITPYLTSVFEEGFKILDARNLQKTLSVKLHVDEFRLIIIKSPTLDAQNALLKTLEELQDQVYVIFCVVNKEELLPTVLSRALLIDCGAPLVKEDEKIVELLMNGNFAEVLSRSESNTENLDQLILSLRKACINSLKNKPQAALLLQILKKITTSYSLSKTNNVNKKMAIESPFMACAFSTS